MSPPVRAFVILVATFAVAGGSVVIEGCVSKPPQPESTSPAAPQPPQSESALPAAKPSPSESAATAAPSSGLPGATPDERRAVIDKRLNASLGAFDAKLRGEQQKVAQERDARQHSVVTVAAVDTNDSRGTGLNRSRSNGSRDSGDLKSEKASAGVALANAGNGAVATEIPDGNDDDVVARRLRKAAELETDPELKDKLWKEYVEYKKNMQGK